MELIRELWSYIGHINEHLGSWVTQYGGWVYGILFLIIFCETGLVIMPFLPGDSLLFAVGAICVRDDVSINIWLVSLMMIVAAILGDSLNYLIGRRSGRWMMRRFPKIVKADHIEKTNAFFTKYGGKTIIIARFVPLVRTFAPFVAGSSEMDYRKFMTFNVIGAILWVGLIVPAGYLLGGIEIVKKHFELVVIGIIVISLIPAVVGWLKSSSQEKTKPAPSAEEALKAAPKVD